MMNERIERQIQEILEEGTGEHRSVIVRMAGQPRNVRPILQEASKALDRRRVALTARDSLPEDRQPEQIATTATPQPLIRSDPQAN
jgi:hypothetical protein